MLQNLLVFTVFKGISYKYTFCDWIDYEANRAIRQEDFLLKHAISLNTSYLIKAVHDNIDNYLRVINFISNRRHVNYVNFIQENDLKSILF